MADPLLEAIVAADLEAVAALLRGRPEPERRALAPPLVKLARAAGRAEIMRLGPDGVEMERLIVWDRQIWEQGRALSLALLGTASWTELRRVGAWRGAVVDVPHGPEVLLDRRPDWLERWPGWVLGSQVQQAEAWRQVRAMVRAGAVAPPDSVAYSEGMLTVAFWGGGAGPLLEADPGLLEHEIWELFAVEVDLTSADKSGAGWQDAVLARVADGRMPRERVLDATLDALGREFSAYHAGWYSRLWKTLAVTREERLARTETLRVLLGAAPAFAVDELVRDGGAPPSQLGAALSAPAKKTVRAALKLLDRAVRDDPALREEAAIAATAALVHEGADVQGEVLDRLERWGVPGEALLGRVEGLTATQRPRAEGLLGITMPVTEATAVDMPSLEAIPEPIRAALALEPFGPVPPAPVAGEPVLDGASRIAPITSLEELSDVLAGALVAWEPNQDERLLDGILRHCGSRDPFHGPLNPLIPKLQPLGNWMTIQSVVHVAWAWLMVAEPDPPPQYFDHSFEMRLHEAARRAARGDARPLLARSTHAGGWIDPAALIARMELVGEDADERDLAQALLRLAPDGRAAALAAAADLPGRPGALVRCALGGDDVADDGAAAAAARAASGRPEPVRVEIEFRREQERAIDRLRAVLDGPAPSRAPEHNEPLADHLDGVSADDDSRRERWPDPTAWPARRDLACAGAIGRIGWNLTDVRDRSGAEPVLELLVRSGEPLAPAALRLATLALCSSVEGEHIVAVDLLVAAIADGRADADALAPSLRADLARGLIIPNRLGTRLSIIATAGTLHRAVVRNLLDAIVAALADRPPRTYAALVVPFDELSAQTGSRVRSVAARAFLASITGSGQAAKAAQGLLARDGDPPPEERTLALEARLRRAERWLSA